ncbi:MAG TPA: DUF6787 family protein [Bacteroidales bacterium]|nr:DUF6787 family protein [Bacteroidales bacterium]
MKYFTRFKTKWKIKSNKQFWLIMGAFAITGTSILFTKPLLFDFFGIDGDLHIVPYSILYLIIITPVYFVTLLVIGSLLGQYRFFNKFILKMLRIRN